MGRRTYTEKEKQEALAALASGESSGAVATRLGISAGTLRSWAKRARDADESDSLPVATPLPTSVATPPSVATAATSPVATPPTSKKKRSTANDDGERELSGLTRADSVPAVWDTEAMVVWWTELRATDTFQKLTEKQQQFVLHYCGPAAGNATEAARAAGYSDNNPDALRSWAARLLGKEHVKAAVEFLMARISMGPMEVVWRIAMMARPETWLAMGLGTPDARVVHQSLKTLAAVHKLVQPDKGAQVNVTITLEDVQEAERQAAPKVQAWRDGLGMAGKAAEC